MRDQYTPVGKRRHPQKTALAVLMEAEGAKQRARLVEIAALPLPRQCEYTMKGQTKQGMLAGKRWKRPCPNRAVVEVGGKHFCKEHAPK